MSNVKNFDGVLKALYPLDGTRKGWAAKACDWSRRLNAQGNRTRVAYHEDNCGTRCRNVGEALIYDMRHHDCCYWCNDEGEKHEVGFDEPMPMPDMGES